MKYILSQFFSDKNNALTFLQKHCQLYKTLFFRLNFENQVYRIF